ncbi:MAG: hypothetical protein K2F94_00375 [Muribaculaceae bacterium]|nr:hypothetical protein [Muribaculaceae bacterium]
MMRKNTYAGIAILLIMTMLFAGCADRTASEALEHADAVLDEMPDSALAIISGIDTTRLNTGRLRADYSLMRTMSLLKTDPSSATEEGLRDASDYYGDSDKPSRQAMLTHFAKGSFADSIKKSVIEYRTTVELAHGNNAALYKAIALLNLASDLIVHKNSAKARETLDEASEYLKEINDTSRNIHYALISGIAYNALGEFDSAEQDMTYGLRLAGIYGDSVTADKIRLNLSRTFEGTGRYEEALDMLETASRSGRLRLNKSDAMLYARLMAYCGNEVHAMDVLDRCETDSSNDGMLEYYFTKSEILAAGGDITGAYRLLRDSVVAYGNRVVIDRYRFSSDAEMLDHETGLREESEEIAEMSEREVYYLVALVILIICAGYLFIRQLRTRHEIEMRNQEEEKQQGFAILNKTIDRLEVSLGKTLEENKALSDRVADLEESRKLAERGIAMLESSIQKLERGCKEKDERNNELSEELAELRHSKSLLKQNLEEARKEIETVRKSQLRQFLSYHRTIAGFCKKAPKGCEDAAKAEYEKKRLQYLRIYKEPEYLESLKLEIDVLMNGTLSFIQHELELPDSMMSVVVLDICGFNYICMGEILEENSKTVSSKKTRLKNSIETLHKKGAEQCAQYFSIIKEM